MAEKKGTYKIVDQNGHTHGKFTGTPSSIAKEFNQQETARTYKVMNGEGHEYGRYTGLPRQAASKAFTAITKKNPDLKDITITLRETTRDSKHKTYQYHCQRQKLEQPVHMEMRGSNGDMIPITYMYRNKIQRVKME